MNTDIQDAVEKVKSIITDGFIAQPRLALTPVIFAVDKDHKIHSMSLTDVPKMLCKPVMAAYLKEVNATAYMFVDEAWSTSISEKSEHFSKLMRNEMVISELPLDDRAEVVIIIAVENGGKIETHVTKIVEVKGQRSIGSWDKNEEVVVGLMPAKW